MLLRLLVSVLLLMSAGCRAEPQTMPAQASTTAFSPAGLELIPLEIRSGAATHRFTVEVARTPDEQARGLMYRQKLGPSEGMLFPFNPPRPASFWMKNTLIPLDLLFIRADGSIAEIAANATPLSLAPLAVGVRRRSASRPMIG